MPHHEIEQMRVCLQTVAAELAVASVIGLKPKQARRLHALVLRRLSAPREPAHAPAPAFGPTPSPVAAYGPMYAPARGVDAARSGIGRAVAEIREGAQDVLDHAEYLAERVKG